MSTQEPKKARRAGSTGAATVPKLLELYEEMLLARTFELTVARLGSEGEIPGFLHLYVGEEASAVGILDALDPDDWVVSNHRGHGHAVAKGLDPKEMLAELFGKKTGTNGGRGGSMHLFSPRLHFFGTNGIVAAGLPQAVGLGFSAQTKKTGQVVVCFFGDGASNHGLFHESLNLASINNSPVIFVCENNLYATCIHVDDSTKNTNIAGKAASYGIPGVRVEGNDVLAVREAALEAVERARSGGGPTLIETMTYRHLGHHQGDAPFGQYRTKEELESWKERDPIPAFRSDLERTGVSVGEIEAVEARVKARMGEAVEFARSSPWPETSTANTHVWAEPINPPLDFEPATCETVTKNWLESTRDGLAEEMRRDPHILYFGEGIGPRGGTFAHTKGLWEEFGPKRVIDTPISEAAFTGAAISASAVGCRSVADLMFSDFIMESASQIIHQAAKLRYVTDGAFDIPVIIRAATGMMRNAGPHHSDSYHPIWAHIPGLIVVTPSNPADAKGLLKTALRAGDPVVYLDHKRLLSMKGPVPTVEHYVPFGCANVVRSGDDITVVSNMALLHVCMEAAANLEKEGIGCEVIDLRTIVPLDIETIIESVMKTRHLLVVDEAYAMCGIGAEIGAAMMEHAFDWLDAPVGRLHTDPVSIPYSPPLENEIAVDVTKTMISAKAVLEGRPVVVRRPRGRRLPPAVSAASASTLTEPTVVAAEAANAPQEAMQAQHVPLKMPVQDLTISEATIVRWIKQPGDPVKTDEPVVEVETDKALFDVVSPTDGVLVEILEPEGTVIALGQRIGFILPESTSP